MSKYIYSINATAKVIYDKTIDYISYYSGIVDVENKNEDDANDDTIQDYDGVIKIELYENESTSTRIFQPSSYYDEYNTFFSKPTHIVDNIYLGSAYNAASYSTLKDFDIKVIINATTEIREYYPDEFIYLRYKLYDNNKHSIKKYLEESFKDIQYHQKNTSGNILVHCFMGASRSASLVIYYLMKTKKNSNGRLFNFDEAVQFIREKRIIVNPTFRLTKDLANSIINKI